MASRRSTVAIAFETQQDIAKENAERAKGMHMCKEDKPEELVSRASAGRPRPVHGGDGLLRRRSADCSGLLSPSLTDACRVHSRRKRHRLLLAVAGFVAIYLVPNLKYPANPPSVGNPETIGMRTALYFVMIAISVAAISVPFRLKRLLRSLASASGIRASWSRPITSSS